MSVALRQLSENPITDVDIVVLDPLLVEHLSKLTSVMRAERPSNDVPTGADLLDIAIEARSLADLLLLRELEPPLAVGVLGGWGSGKSFVMHLIQQRMDEIRAKQVPAGQAWPEADGTAWEYVGHVYQVRFNAWTYAHTDLWAALMYTIFDELNRQLAVDELLGKFDDPDEPLDGAVWEALNAMTEVERAAILSNPEALEQIVHLPTSELKADRLWTVLREVRSTQRVRLRELEQERDTTLVEFDKVRRELELDVDNELEDESRAAVWIPLRDRLAQFLGVNADDIEGWIDKQLVGGAPASTSPQPKRPAAAEPGEAQGARSGRRRGPHARAADVSGAALPGGEVAVEALLAGHPRVRGCRPRVHPRARVRRQRGRRDLRSTCIHHGRARRTRARCCVPPGSGRDRCSRKSTRTPTRSRPNACASRRVATPASVNASTKTRRCEICNGTWPRRTRRSPSNRSSPASPRASSRLRSW